MYPNYTTCCTIEHFTQNQIKVEGQFIYFCNSLQLLVPTYGIWDQHDSTLCIICMYNFKDIIYFPCRHIVVCRICNLRIVKCPICRTNIQGFAIFRGIYRSIELLRRESLSYLL